MIIRPAKRSDSKFIQEIFTKYDFKLDSIHLKSIWIAEDSKGPIAVMSINTVLECSFLTADDRSRKDKISSLVQLVEVGKEEIKNLKYDGIHAFANAKIAEILKKHFSFVPGKGENLYLFVD